jgi:hypothetical protein
MIIVTRLKDQADSIANTINELAERAVDAALARRIHERHLWVLLPSGGSPGNPACIKSAFNSA